MKLVTYVYEGLERVGAVTPDRTAVVELPALGVPCREMTEAIRYLGEDGRFAALRERWEEGCPGAEAVPLGAVRLLAPIPRPARDVICLGLNYDAHAREFTRDDPTGRPRQAVYFSKRAAWSPGPDAEIDGHPELVEDLDYEVELGVILGRDAVNVRREDAAGYVFGYTVFNDLSARTLQKAHQQWFRGKSLDGFAPMGPWIVTADEIPFPPALDLGSRVNGQLRQRGNTRDMIFGVGEILEELSRGMTLEAGTILATGTPAGVAMGMDRPRFLKAGDVVECEIQHIGILRNIIR